MTTQTIFNQSFFAEHFDKFEDMFNRYDAHPESFYKYFYDEFIYGTDILSDEDKATYMDEWRTHWDNPEEEESLKLPFDEFIEEEEYYKEDVACDAIGEHESLRQKAIPQLFIHISEMWSEESIQDAIAEVTQEVK